MHFFIGGVIILCRIHTLIDPKKLNINVLLNSMYVHISHFFCLTIVEVIVVQWSAHKSGKSMIIGSIPPNSLSLSHRFEHSLDRAKTEPGLW